MFDELHEFAAGVVLFGIKEILIEVVLDQSGQNGLHMFSKANFLFSDEAWGRSQVFQEGILLIVIHNLATGGLVGARNGIRI